MRRKLFLLTLSLIIFILGCKTHTLIPNSQLKNIDATLKHVGDRWEVRMVVQNGWKMSISSEKEPLLIQTAIDGNNLVATWSVDDSRIRTSKPFAIFVKSESESFPVELEIPVSTKKGYTIVMIVKTLTGH